MKIVVTGGSGMLGHILMRLARAELHEVWGSFHTHRIEIPGCRMFAMDLTDERRSQEQLKSARPDVVVHTAALTDVDQCEREPEATRRVNVLGTKILAQAAEEVGARFLYISTDYVFDGRKGDYSEQDAPAPLNRYGESKLLAEEWVRRCCADGLILRTTMFGLKLPPRKGLMETLLEALRSGGALSRFSDQYFTPLYTGQFGRSILRLIEAGASGLFHLGTKQKVSRFDFARELAKVFGIETAITPVPFRQIEGLARRPKDSSLVSARVEQRWGIEAADLQAGLAELKSDTETMSREGTAGR